MTTSIVTPEIVEFATAVRAALADLPSEEVDDLTDGLEADLSESFAEDIRRELPDPVEYADELRGAAGLPVRTRQISRFAGLAQGWRDTLADVGVTIRRNPALGGALDFALSLRPVWWLVRAWLAVWLLGAFFGAERGYVPGGGWLLVLVAAAVVSAQWGRGRWLPQTGLPWLIGTGNVIALVLILPALAAINSTAGSSAVDSYDGSAQQSSDPARGIALDGRSVTNIFAYGADGKPLKDVQLFDQEGRALVPHFDPVRDECLDGACTANGKGLTFVPSTLETGAKATNVFPLSMIASTLDDNGVAMPDPAATPAAPKAPYLKVPALLVPQKVAKINQ